MPSTSPPQPRSLRPHVESLVDATEKGRFAEPPCFTTRSIGPWTPSLATPARLPGSRWSTLMCLGVAAFLAFAQQTVTRPIRKFLPFPLRFPQTERGVIMAERVGREGTKPIDFHGSDLLGNFFSDAGVVT